MKGFIVSGDETEYWVEGKVYRRGDVNLFLEMERTTVWGDGRDSVLGK